MRTIEANNWCVLNNIIYKIYTTVDAEQMRSIFLEQMKFVIEYDSAEFYLTDLEDGHQFVNAVCYNCEEDGAKQFNDMVEISKRDVFGKTFVFRNTDILNFDARVNATVGKDYFEKNNWSQSLHLLLGDGEMNVALISFYRSVGKERFSSDDVFVLDLMKDHLLHRLLQERLERASMQEKLTVTEATEHYNLTKRESMILRRLMQGHNNNQISEELHISVNTLKKHVLNIYRKLNINNRVQLFKAIKEKE